MADKSYPEQISALNTVSPSFCLAKWLQVTIDLVHGLNHSCHHPLRHDIPIAELAENPGALHNTQYKKRQRKMMLNGVRPKECQYCWDVEDGGCPVSDRIIKSTDSWAWPELERIRSLPWDADVHPTYLEVMLDNICNFSCMYCMADISTSIQSEMARFGRYSVSHWQHRMPSGIPENPNPFIEAFWKWLPEILPSLQVLRVTGGEPLLSSHMPKLLDYLRSNRQPDLTFIMNSHLSHSESKIKAFLEPIRSLLETRSIKDFEIYTSADTAGKQAEYIRFGLRYTTLIKNIETIVREIPQAKVVIMCTFNILSIPNFQLFLEDILRIRKIFPTVTFDTSYLRNPAYLRANIADESLKTQASLILEFMKSQSSPGFYPHEIMKLENVLTWMNQPVDIRREADHRRDFYSFITEYDRRKKTSFLDIFPSYEGFFDLCRQVYESRPVPTAGA